MTQNYSQAPRITHLEYHVKGAADTQPWFFGKQVKSRVAFSTALGHGPVRKERGKNSRPLIKIV